ncbi:MAG: carbohydrate binding family 9 domain-containing protein, partial [Longimicrobiales bacterium]
MPRPRARAIRTALPIRLDGVLDDEAWAAAEPISGFVQSMPDAGAPATEETVVRVLYDEENLYIGALMRDSEPSEIIAQYLNQDFETHDDDVFAVTLDTFKDRRNSFMFLINPNGAVKDGQTFDNSRTINLAWEGVIHIETSVHREGWTAEVAIPFTTLRFDPTEGEQSWGMNFLRRIRRKNEDSY